MGISVLKSKKGQISIEFILIILIALIYIHSVIQPTIPISSQSTEDVTRLSQAKLAAEKLAGAMNQLEANKGEGRKTISLFIPKNSFIKCDTEGGEPVVKFWSVLSNVGLCTVDNPSTPTEDESSCHQGCEKDATGENITCTGFIELLEIPGSCVFGTSSQLGDESNNIMAKLLVERETGKISVDYAP